MDAFENLILGVPEDTWLFIVGAVSLIIFLLTINRYLDRMDRMQSTVLDLKSRVYELEAKVGLPMRPEDEDDY